MSKSKKRKDNAGQSTTYKIIPQSAYEDRHLFKAGSLMAAIGLSLSAVIATMPQTVFDIKTVSLDPAAAAAYVQEYSDTSCFYTNDSLVNFEVDELSEVTELLDDIYNHPSPKVEIDFASYTTSLSNEDAEKKLAEIEAEKAEKKKAEEAAAAKEAAKKAAAAQAAALAAAKKAISSGNVTVASSAAISSAGSSGFVRLNSKGLAMSEKTAPSWLQLDANGIPVNYKYCIQGKTTAYCTGYITSTGTRPVQGTVAVDPNEIPYGTKMYITSADGRYIYGYAVAEDTGGFASWANGATADLYMRSESDALAWGFRNANIYILD